MRNRYISEIKARLERFALLLGLASLSTLLACQKSDLEGPEVGAQLPNLLHEARLRNAPVGAEAPRAGWVVYAFSPQSSSCVENSARVESLADSLTSDWAFLAVATEEEGLAPFLDRLRVTVPVVTQTPQEILAAYQLTGSPRTYILDRDWKLLAVLDGAYRGEVADRLASLLNVPIERSATGTSPPQDGSPPRQRFPPGVCLDNDQDPYSPGAKADVLGQLFQCASGGVWIPAA